MQRFHLLKLKRRNAGKGAKFTYVPKVSELKPNKIKKFSSPVIIEKLPNELNIGETKSLNPVFENDGIKGSTRNQIGRAHV